MSPKHLGRYVNEFAGRHNDRPLDTIQQMRAIVRGLEGKRALLPGAYGVTDSVLRASRRRGWATVAIKEVGNFMTPTTEHPRTFHVLRKMDGQELTFCADTICDVNGYGTYLRFNREGKTVGEAQGDMHAWWLDDGLSGKTYRIEVPTGNFIAIVADSKERPKDVQPPREIFRRGGEIVATIFTDYHTWSVDD